ncbi:hypothetical protein BIW11_08569 [Tropilaelaps mercedesae]|uniref:Uncharacterized protein n=1 Tax=Tropilaelaps mercedesae TaxID=418985 RepID=A0A1V9XNY0_9ACAR|nr:hypothetical protein BIW11_08569 [Tropilaelaps mercedesae]
MARNSEKDGYWVPLHEEIDQKRDLPSLTWNDLKNMLTSVGSHLDFLSGDVKHFIHEWLRETYGGESPRNVEELYKNLSHDWLPYSHRPDDDLDGVGGELPSVEVAYKETEVALQKFCIVMEQANVDHTVQKGRTFKNVGGDIVQVLSTLRQHMRALRIEPDPPVTRNIMSDEERRAFNRADSKVIRRLKEHPELKPACVED